MATRKAASTKTPNSIFALRTDLAHAVASRSPDRLSLQHDSLNPALTLVAGTSSNLIHRGDVEALP